MTYAIVSATPVLSGALMRIEYTQDGGPVRRAFFTTAELRQTTQGAPFELLFPLWLRARAAHLGTSLKDLNLAGFRSFVVGQTIAAEPTDAAARAKDGV